MNWRKCPSVRAGGKPYFYVSIKDCIKLATVVWDRIDLVWLLTDSKERVIKTFKTNKQAMAYADSIVF